MKRYGSNQVIHGVDLEIADGEFCVFVGPSGCGKSTLLRMIAGLEETSAGSIHIGKRDITHLDPAMRGVAMVFQTYALYPHMTVAENMGFGLRMNKVAKAQIKEKVSRAAAILKLQPYLGRKPKALSGGQRQRVAIGRAIVRGPEVFLFDEPLSNLDAELRVEMRAEIARLHRGIGSTMIYVTHDQVEAMTMADKIVVLRSGKIEQVGAPLELYRNPECKFVAGFIGSPAMNFLAARLDGGWVTVPGLGERIKPHVALPAGAREVLLGIRPEHLRIEEGGRGMVAEFTEELGGVSYVHLQSGSGERLIVEQRQEQRCKSGQQVSVSFAPQKAFYFDPQTELRFT